MLKVSIRTQNKEAVFDKNLMVNLTKYVFKKINFLKRGKNIILDITFLPEEEMRNLNRKYRRIDKKTSSLAFSYGSPFNNEKTFIGEILLNEKVLKKKQNKFLEIFLHALLHIGGYNHSKPAERKKMFALQKNLLDELIRKKWC